VFATFCLFRGFLFSYQENKTPLKRQIVASSAAHWSIIYGLLGHFVDPHIHPTAQEVAQAKRTRKPSTMAGSKKKGKYTR